MNETSNKLRIFIINMAAQSLGELQESEIISKVNDAVENKLIFYMYLSGYSSAYIAKTLEELGKTTFLGNTKWTSNTVIQIRAALRRCSHKKDMDSRCDQS